ncbi:ATP-binding protein [Allokutzneria sp. A3M-2-11 16]|uniref:ATP-binding protein n=1 Tax=Allokutzneria sp. A3M-2-11 16 TaxID=2962043 RepID=UPI0020B6C214|nr:ATP-binding protein [Allokutzneria sp. A3M-2-11 16]MCP3801089.1 ATP-binding protein [Allokutzneria sp. A3M-2-11 16]
MPEAASSETMRTVVALQRDPGSCAAVRALVTNVLGRWGMPEDLVRDAVLVANELVANAVEHGAGPVWFGLSRTGTGIRMETGDNGADLPRLRSTGPRDERHRGLVIVGALSTGWGTEHRADGKVVWATMSA